MTALSLNNHTVCWGSRELHCRPAEAVVGIWFLTHPWMESVVYRDSLLTLTCWLSSLAQSVKHQHIKLQGRRNWSGWFGFSRTTFQRKALARTRVQRNVRSGSRSGRTRPLKLTLPIQYHQLPSMGRLAAAIAVCTRALPCWKSVPKCTRIDLRTSKIQIFPGEHAPRPP